MARKSDALGVRTAETVIGAGVTLSGPLNGEGDIIIDGQLTGQVITTGDIIVGVNGQLKGPVTGHNVTVIGRVKGSITAEGDVLIRESGHVTGDITADSLTIARGGIFNGRSRVSATELETTEEV